jgi:predicted GIY-YIG superfamily endonuclease
MVRCHDKTLYTGITTDLDARLVALARVVSKIHADGACALSLV